MLSNELTAALHPVGLQEVACHWKSLSVSRRALLTQVVAADFEGLISPHQKPYLTRLLVLQHADLSDASFLPLRRLRHLVESEQPTSAAKHYAHVIVSNKIHAEHGSAMPGVWRLG